MKRDALLPPETLRACARQGVVPTRYILAVSIAAQTTSLFERNGASRGTAGEVGRAVPCPPQDGGLTSTPQSPRDGGQRSARPTFYDTSTAAPVPAASYKCVQSFRCSTSKYGVGESSGSNKTPRGLHRIAEKFGGGWPVGTVFEGRKMVGFTWSGRPFAPIASRLFWLEGLEPGRNQGANIDSYDRYIYIHGVGNETTLGRPSSQGCIHLAAKDLIPLYDELPLATLVWIAER